MQLYRTISGNYKRSLFRKLTEAIGALVINRRFTKQQILRCYLRIAYFGTGLTGVIDGTNALYGKEFDFMSYADLDRLTLEQASTVASLLVYPKPRVINNNWRTKVTRRSNYCRRLLATKNQIFN